MCAMKSSNSRTIFLSPFLLSELSLIQPVIDDDSLATISVEDAASASEREKLEKRKNKIQEAKMRRQSRKK